MLHQRIVVARIGLNEAVHAIVIQIAQVLRQLSTIHTVQRRAQAFFKNPKGLADGIALAQHITTGHRTARGGNGIDQTFIQQADQLVLVDGVHAGFNVDTLVGICGTGAVGTEHGGVT